MVAALPAAMTVAMRAMAPTWAEVLVEGGALGGIELTIERPDRRVSLLLFLRPRRPVPGHQVEPFQCGHQVHLSAGGAL